LGRWRGRAQTTVLDAEGFALLALGVARGQLHEARRLAAGGERRRGPRAAAHAGEHVLSALEWMGAAVRALTPDGGPAPPGGRAAGGQAERRRGRGRGGDPAAASAAPRQ
jgi:hypothetical protein